MNTLILESTENGDMPLDVYQKLANDRILFICDHISDALASDIVATLILKDQESQDEKITLFINSTGGDIRNAFMIYDVMKMISAPIETVCNGCALDEAAIILAAGEPGRRLASKHSVISISPLQTDFYSHSTIRDAKAVLDQQLKDNKRVMQIFADVSGKSLSDTQKEFDRRVFMNANEAKKFGIVDKIIAGK